MANWQDELNLPDDLKTSEVLAQYETIDDALKGFINTKSMVGRSIVIPGEDAGEDQWAEYREKLQKTAPNLTLHPEHADEEHAKEFWRIAGVPEDTKGYEVAEDYEGLPIETLENLRNVALAAGWTKKQFTRTVDALTKDFLEQQQTFTESRQADTAIVDKKFGLAKEQKMTTIKAFAEQFADPNHPPAWLNDPNLLTAGDILMMDNIVANYQGKGPQAFTQPTGGDRLTPDEIRQKQEDIRNRLLKEQHTMPRPEYQRLTKKLVSLGEMLVQS